MLKLYGAPRTRAVRVTWLLAELGIDYELELVRFKPTGSEFFIQDTPTGKIPTLVDGATVICESGAIVEYILERYGEGRLRPPPGSGAGAEFLQWFHFAEASAFAPIGNVVWLTRYRQDADQHRELVADAIERARRTLQFVADRLPAGGYLAGPEFSAADIMMGFTLLAATELGMLEGFTGLETYLQRLTQREGFRIGLARLESA